MQRRPRRRTCGIPQHRKINCTLQMHLQKKWWAAMCYAGLAPKSLLKVMRRCKFGDAKERAAFRSTHSAVPLRKLLRLLQLRLPLRSRLRAQLRKSNCTLQNALVEKAAWCVAGCYAGLYLKVC